MSTTVPRHGMVRCAVCPQTAIRTLGKLYIDFCLRDKLLTYTLNFRLQQDVTDVQYITGTPHARRQQRPHLR